MIRSTWPTILLLLLAVAIPAAGQTEAVATPAGNVAVTIKIGRIEAGRPPLEQVYKMVVRDGADTAQMLVGWRMPIPTGKRGESDDATRTEYVYQNIGLTARFRVAHTPSGPYALDGELEVSGATKESLQQPATGGTPPVIGTFQQRLSVLLPPNTPLRVAEGPHPEGGTVFVELEAHALEGAPR